MQLQELEHWLTPSDVARELGISKQRVHVLIGERRFRGVHTRQGWLFDPEDIEDRKHERAARETKARIERGEGDVIPWEQAKREINEGRVPE